MIYLFVYVTRAHTDVFQPGAMSWAFLEAMKSHGDPTYKEVSHSRSCSMGLAKIS
jgi:hypothetical protein